MLKRRGGEEEKEKCRRVIIIKNNDTNEYSPRPAPRYAPRHPPGTSAVRPLSTKYAPSIVKLENESITLY